MKLFISVAEARGLLPQVGDRLERVPSLIKMPGRPTPPPRMCTVVEVNREHLWYRVVFDKTGYSECYKVPEGGEVK